MKKFNFLLLAILMLVFACKKENTAPPKTENGSGNPVTEQPDDTTQPKPEKVLIVVTSNNKLKNGNPAGYYLPEALDFYKVMKAKGIKADFASPNGGKAPMYSRNEFIDYYRPELEETGILNYLDSTKKISDIKYNEYKAIYYVGGFACLFDFPVNTELAALAANIYEKNNGVVAAVCHGPAGLLNIKLSNGELLIKGRKITSRISAEDTEGTTREYVLKYAFPFILQEELTKSDADFKHGAAWSAYIEIDNRIITGQGPEASTGIANEVARIIKE